MSQKHGEKNISARVWEVWDVLSPLFWVAITDRDSSWPDFAWKWAQSAHTVTNYVSGEGAVIKRGDASTIPATPQMALWFVLQRGKGNTPECSSGTGFKQLSEWELINSVIYSCLGNTVLFWCSLNRLKNHLPEQSWCSTDRIVICRKVLTKFKGSVAWINRGWAERWGWLSPEFDAQSRGTKELQTEGPSQAPFSFNSCGCSLFQTINNQRKISRGFLMLPLSICCLWTTEIVTQHTPGNLQWLRYLLSHLDKLRLYIKCWWLFFGHFISCPLWPQRDPAFPPIKHIVPMYLFPGERKKNVHQEKYPKFLCKLKKRQRGSIYCQGFQSPMYS